MAPHQPIELRLSDDESGAAVSQDVRHFRGRQAPVHRNEDGATPDAGEMHDEHFNSVAGNHGDPLPIGIARGFGQCNSCFPNGRFELGVGETPRLSELANALSSVMITPFDLPVVPEL